MKAMKHIIILDEDEIKEAIVQFLSHEYDLPGTPKVELTKNAVLEGIEIRAEVSCTEEDS